MKTVYTVNEVRNIIKEWKSKGLSIGFVPTMGYLHEGHKSLIEKAAAENDKVVVSIFVNPIQFGPGEDYKSYPRNLKRDEKICEPAGVNLIFAPSSSEMYLKNGCTYVNVEGITECLCGEKRAGHFKGVCTVVAKLFHILAPNKAYFGEKDAQQLAVIKRMVQDLNFEIEIVGCPIVREADGLAKSSRNTYLLLEERKAALVLKRCLDSATEILNHGERNVEAITKVILRELDLEPLAIIDYVEIVDSCTLKPVQTVESSILVAIAVFIGKTRLIDNFTFQS